MSETEGLDEDRIRDRAYHLWEGDGRPEGRSDEFWERARIELATTSDLASVEPSISEPPGQPIMTDPSVPDATSATAIPGSGGSPSKP